MSSWMSVLSLVLCYGTTLELSNRKTERLTEEYAEMYRKVFKAIGMTSSPVADIPSGAMGQKGFQCNLLNISPPTTVHELSPKYVDVVAAMGDSVTAAFGARSSSILGLFTEYRGVSWSIGGDKTINEVMTLPNVIKHFNPGLTGFSTGIGGPDSSNAGLNVAVTGSWTSDMQEQAETLVRRMREQGITDKQWKVITIWIGANDLCNIGLNDNPSDLAKIYIENIKQALDILKDNVKRAFVNVVQMIELSDLSAFKSFECKLVHGFVCSGASSGVTREMVSKVIQLYHQRLEELINNGKTYDSDDFAVVLQPFLTQTLLPRLPDGNIDSAYFAPDCFHFSQLGHSVTAAYLWNSLFEPVGQKTTIIEWDNLRPLTCPTDWPYFSTYGNQVARENALLSAHGSNVENGLFSQQTDSVSSYNTCASAMSRDFYDLIQL